MKKVDPQSAPSMNVSSPLDLTRREVLKMASAGALAAASPAHLLSAVESSPPSSNIDTRRLARTHDLTRLSQWGPYSKEYFGITHVPDPRRGISFDLSLFPAPAEGSAILPSALLNQSGFHPWEASSDVEFLTLRMEEIGKDDFYCDLSFFPGDDASRLIRMEFVNRTASPQRLKLHSLAKMNFPPLKPWSPEPTSPYRVALPGVMWVHALDYTDLRFARPRPTDNLVPEGRLRGEDRMRNTVDGSAVGQGFGKDAGDTVSYEFDLARPMAKAALVWRYLAKERETVVFHMTGSVQRDVVFAGKGEFTSVVVPLGAMTAGPVKLTFSSAGGASVALNGFVLLEADQAGADIFVKAPWRREPVVARASAANGSILTWPDQDACYGIVMGQPLADSRTVPWVELDEIFGKQNDPRMKLRMLGNPDQHNDGDAHAPIAITSSEPFTVEGHSTRVIYGLVCTGTKQDVERRLAAFQPQSRLHETRYLAARAKAYQVVSTPAGEPYRLSQQLMSTLTLSNLVYPAYIQREYVRHYTCGRCWDSLYTWDSGFLGIGLAELDVQCAVDILNAYTTPPGSQSAFILHGTPLPVQVYLFMEIWNRTQSQEILAYFYPRVAQFYRFIAGRLGSSTTRQHKEGLICTWDYFYNTGGWDDYPPQKYVHEHNLTATTAPVVSTSHVIRCAKLLRQAAKALGRTQDLAGYNQDIASLSTALQKYSWDQDSGYFGYVVHDDEGNPTGILRDGTGANFNMGLDGVSPLTAGICKADQQRALLDRIFTKGRMWTDIGITTVDQTASYYNPNGYWNGCVWFPHQWFLWKTMLDLGRGDLANRIAVAGIDVWKRATDSTYDCFEHFVVKTGKGDGWHQFTTLSCPVLSWFASLYRPGRLTCGFEVWQQACEFSSDNRRLRATLVTGDERPSQHFHVLACMKPDAKYDVRWNGKPAKFQVLHEALLQIELPYEGTSGELRIESV